MSCITIKQYMPEDEKNWNRFNAVAKNSLFMFDRNYMDYHKDRFADHSLLFYDDDKLAALLPMSEKDGVLTSHGGLTYGGFITGSTMKQHTMNDCFDALREYMSKEGFSELVYKAIPHIYHEQPAEEDRYALFLHDARQIKVEAATVVNLKKPLKMPKATPHKKTGAKIEQIM